MFQGILFVLHTGISWEHLPQELGFGSGMTCWRRLTEWTEADVWPRLHEALLAKLRSADALDFSRAAFSASSGAGGWAGSCVRRPRGRLTPAALTQFRSVSGLIPRSAATDLIVASGRDSYNATASALNSGG
ncbi:Transposase [Streptomyces sp. AmelKG-D3]|nr:Transposase [Streptomyces sp. AmelKG-D3]